MSRALVLSGGGPPAAPPALFSVRKPAGTRSIFAPRTGGGPWPSDPTVAAVAELTAFWG
jgi:hypothetical protein